MESWIEFGRGPLFRIAFSLMLLGLLRAVALTAIGIAEAYRQSPDKIVNWREVRKQTFAWLFPVNAALARTACLQHVLFLISCRVTYGPRISICACPVMEALSRVCMVHNSAVFGKLPYRTRCCNRHGFVSQPCS